MVNIQNRNPDVEVLFEFNGTRKNPVVGGYSPSHLIKENYLAIGLHKYYEKEFVESNGTAKGTITFIVPEEYPGCLWVGKEIPFFEGERKTGKATVVKIYNKILEK